ncbi:hypothetical protein [Streptomyces sp. NBC_00385]|uniref:hypothetical protein n=1 Tax=Streptomyces sp. NBC_00385 TaxID=2975733 RepID=UPI002DD80807|nr:hypothetical protein [Streptomyces sp. NBC_00385]WRZ03011.1 hypothetical protein OG959_06450 [Streptomyces sp. NBC_00385]
MYAYTSGTNGALTDTKKKMWSDSMWGVKTHFANADFNSDGRDGIAAVSPDGGLDLYSGNASGRMAAGRQWKRSPAATSTVMARVT